MDSLIQWCNDNSGFIGAVLSVMTVLISVIAIVISIIMARLPFKKKIKISGSIGYLFSSEKESITINGLYINACNIGNRQVNIKYLGFAISKEMFNKYDRLYNIDDKYSSCNPLMPTEFFETMYPADKFINSIVKLDRHRTIYYFAEDTEGKIYKKRFDTVGGVLKNFGL